MGNVKARRVIAATSFVVQFATSALASDPAIAINQVAPRYGDQVNFSVTYPKEARIKVGQQQARNPGIQLDCYQGGLRVYSDNTSVDPGTDVHNADGTISGQTYFFLLGGTSNGLSWTGGEAVCYATLYYFSRGDNNSLVYNFLAQQRDIYVAP